MNYPYSSFWSKYHGWFVELGYPDLDIIEYDDGEWRIIQTYNSPVIPHLCEWNFVLSGLKNIIPTFGLVEKFVHQHDPRRREYWELQEAKSQAIEDNHAAVAMKKAENLEKAIPLVRNNPGLVERIAKNGPQEMTLRNISRHIPNSAFR
jgi:hypothetical protein